MIYPPVRREPVTDVLHGVSVADPYRRLEDPGDPATAEWLAGQDALWRSARFPGREALRARAEELADVGLITAPKWRGDRDFYLRRTRGQEHAVLHAGDNVLIDPGALDPSGLTTLDAWQPDLDGSRLAFQVSTGGTEQSSLYVADVVTGQIIDGPIGPCRYTPVAWLPGDAFYYVRDHKVLLHRLGDAEDVEVFAADGHLGLEVSRDGRWLVISAAYSFRVDLWIADLAASSPEGPKLVPVQEGVAARSAAAVGDDGRLYVVTDRDAPRLRLCVADPARPADWTELVPADPQALLADFAILDGELLVTWLRDGVCELTRHDLGTGARQGTVRLPGAGSVGPLSSRGGEAWFTYGDTVTPAAVWHYANGGIDRWEAAPGGAMLPEIVCRTVRCGDIRITVLGRPSPGGPRPTILHGYGGFGVPMTPSYAADALTWVDAGGVLAIAHLRGGAGTHREGALDLKQQVFDDFHACAAQLITDGWTTPAQLAIWGESNGGLLVGAALTQRPDLFAAAVCSAPLLDMIRYEGSGLGASWTGEYGSVADPEQFGWLLAYSPYHHVVEGTDYPATLFTVFGADTRVDPMHARKMCAALQWATGGDRPILLRHEECVGHGGRSAGRALDLAADLLAFAATHTGLTPPPAPGPRLT
ncbi:MAG: prolyl oligopeptidase family serine peptidase [Streptosporangiaceae bacterium]